MLLNEIFDPYNRLIDTGLIQIPSIKYFTLLCVLLIGAATAIRAADNKNDVIYKTGEKEMRVVNAKIKASNVVYLPEGEEVSEVICGDTTEWVVEGKGRWIFIKPAKENAATNIHIKTKTDNIHSFLIREISRMPNLKPDYIVHLNLGFDPNTLRKEHDALAKKHEELVANVKEVDPKLLKKKKKDLVTLLW